MDQLNQSTAIDLKKLKQVTDGERVLCRAPQPFLEQYFKGIRALDDAKEAHKRYIRLMKEAEAFMSVAMADMSREHEAVEIASLNDELHVYPAVDKDGIPVIVAAKKQTIQEAIRGMLGGVADMMSGFDPSDEEGPQT